MLHKYIAASEKACGYMFEFYEKHNHILKHLVEEKQHGAQARFYPWVRQMGQRKVSPAAEPPGWRWLSSAGRERQCPGDANQAN